jgi:HTH-type transcriptional regulator/antitoxin HigA
MAAESFRDARDWAVAPGEVLSEALEERGMSQSELARRMGRPTKTINEIARGKAAITADTALQLELALGISAALWNGMESNYRAALATQRAAAELESHYEWAKTFPVRQMAQRGLIQAAETKAGKVAELLAFFQVSHPDAWREQWLSPACEFRASPSFSSAPEAVASWLRWGEREASAVDAADYSRDRLLEVLAQLRPMTRREPFHAQVEKAARLLASAGVVLVLTPELPGVHVSGVSRWLSPRRALIQLSLRHKTDDHLWFSLFHEAAHLLDSRKHDHLGGDDGAEDDRESAADRRARDLLIERAAYDNFVTEAKFDARSIRDFAAGQGIAPGILLGRLQHDGHVPHSHLNDLKKRLNWAFRG